MILANLFRRKGRTILTLAGIVIGVAAMVALGALGAGLASGYQAIAGGSQADLVLSQANAVDPTTSVVEERVGDQLRSMPEVRQVAGMIMGTASVQGGAKYFFVFGYHPNEFAIEHFRVVRGEGLMARGVRGRPLLLGKSAAEIFNIDVGDALQLTSSTFRVVGVYETGDAFEEGSAVISLADAQALLQKPRLVSAYHIQLKDTSLSDRFRARVERHYPDLLLTTASEFGDKQQMVGIMEGIGWGISALAIVVGGVGMTNTVLMSVFERTREIGVLRAVGWRRRQVLMLILGESLTLALIGGALGTALGVGVVFAVRNVPLYGILRGQFSPDLFIQAFVTAAVLGIVGGLYPAWRASRLLPLEAMRYDGGGSQRKSALGVAFGGMTLKSLLRRRTRTALTLLGIGIGIGAVVAIGGINEGFLSQFTHMAAGSNAHLMAIETDISDMGYSAIDERVGARIAAYPDIARVSGIVIWFSTDIKGVPLFPLLGYHPHESAIRRFKVVEGEPLGANRQVLLGRAAAEAMGNEVGDTVRLEGSAFRIVGIFESGINWEEMGGVITRHDCQVIAGKPHQVTFYAIEVWDVDRLGAVRAWLSENIPEIDVSLTAEFAESIPDMETMQASVEGIVVLMALVGSAGLTNTILMSVLERTREIGVLRALGWSRLRVLGMIVKEALLLSGFSGLVGIGIGVGLAKVLGVAPVVSNFVQPVFTPTLFVQAMAVAFVLGVLGGLYPAWWASRLHPIEALRYE